MIGSINVYDMNLDRVGVLYSWVSMTWEEGYNTMGAFQLEMQQTDRNLDLVQKDRYCGIADSDTLMLVESVEIVDNEILVNGYPATWIMTQRVSTKEITGVVAETAMRDLFSSMDPWDRTELGASAGLTERFEPQTSDQSIEDYCEILGEECDIGFKMVHDKANKKLLFTCYKPEENKNALYSTMYGNITSIVYTQSDINYKNVAVVAGAGEGDERETVVAGDTSLTGSARREMYVDARQIQMEDGESLSDYRARLVAHGEGKLVDQAKIESVGFTITDDTSLGDIVKANIPEIGISVKARVTVLKWTSQNNGTTKEITVGEPMVLNRL